MYSLTLHLWQAGQPLRLVLGRDRAILGPDRIPPPRSPVPRSCCLEDLVREKYLSRGGRHRHCICGAFFSFSRPSSLGFRKQMHCTPRPSASFKCWPPARAWGRVHQQVYVKSAHCGGWSGGISSRPQDRCDPNMTAELRTLPDIPSPLVLPR